MPTNSSNNSSTPSLHEQAMSRYFRHADWTQNLDRKFAHLSLGIPEDDMIQANRYGIGPGGLAVVVGGLLTAGLLGALAVWWNSSPTAEQPKADSAESEARVRVFWGGEEILPGGSLEATTD